MSNCLLMRSSALASHKEEFKCIKRNINSMREHAELLSSAREDISEYKASGSLSPRMQLLRERAAIHGSISHIDDLISQAQTTRAALGTRRALFGDVQAKVKQLGDKFPVIRGLIGNFLALKSASVFCSLILPQVRLEENDQETLSSYLLFVAACTLFLIIYWLSK